MPPEPQDTTDPATEPFQRECWCGSWQGAPKHEYGTGRYCGEAQSIVVARLASAVGLPGAGVDEIEAAIKKQRADLNAVTGAWGLLGRQVAAIREALGGPEGYDEEDVVLEIRRLRAELAEARRAQPTPNSAAILVAVENYCSHAPSEQTEDGLSCSTCERITADVLRTLLVEARDTGTDDRDGGAHEPVTAGMLRGMAAELDRAVFSTKSARTQAIKDVAADLRSLADLVPAPASPVPPAPDEATSFSEQTRAAHERALRQQARNDYEAIQRAKRPLAEAASTPAPDEARGEDDDDDFDPIEAVHQLQDEQADRFNCDPPGTAAAARRRIEEFNRRLAEAADDHE